jgi:hypothetical protein
MRPKKKTPNLNIIIEPFIFLINYTIINLSVISAKIAYNRKWSLRFFDFHVLNVAKNWLNQLMDDGHLSKHHKIENFST